MLSEGAGAKLAGGGGGRGRAWNHTGGFNFYGNLRSGPDPCSRYPRVRQKGCRCGEVHDVWQH